MLHLQLRSPSQFPIDLDGICPDQMVSLSATACGSLPIQHANREVKLGDLFDISGDAADGHLTVESDCHNVKNLGNGMAGGTLTIRGHAGWHCGANMRAGRIEIDGNSGSWLGAEMRGGTIHVRGDAGDCIGAAYRGSPKGMRGGVILIDGSAGQEAGAHMRRGLIAVAGALGPMAGHAMIAGSIIAFGSVGPRCGAGMKRGSLILYQPPTELPPTFKQACDYQPPFLPVYLRKLAEWGMPVKPSGSHGLFRRYCGDLLALGKGEILVALP